MSSPTAAPSHTALRHLSCLRYGLLGMPLAFVALPLYVHLPHLYANRYGMSLASLGAVLLLARLFDALIDPALGRLVDRLYDRPLRQLRATSALAACLLLLGLVGLFFPPFDDPTHLPALLSLLMLTYLAYSLLSILHQAWGARLGGDELQRARVVAWREAAGLLGVVTASLLPTWLDWQAWLQVFALCLAVGCWAWLSRVPALRCNPHVPSLRTWHTDLLHPWRQALFRRLMGVFVLSGMASAIPATLVLFFIQDRLGAATQGPLFLALYFVAAAFALPLWMHGIARWGLARIWFKGMLLSVAVFGAAAQLGEGDTQAFGWICALSGMALGADLAVPGALLSGLIDTHGDRGSREGSYLGWWNLASKLNLALAAGLSLPLLQWLGYQPGNHNAQGLQALTWAYAVLPCLLKLTAAVLLYQWWLRRLPFPVPIHPEF